VDKLLTQRAIAAKPWIEEVGTKQAATPAEARGRVSAEAGGDASDATARPAPKGRSMLRRHAANARKEH
jgi:hypothetical protein